MRLAKLAANNEYEENSNRSNDRDVRDSVEIFHCASASYGPAISGDTATLRGSQRSPTLLAVTGLRQGLTINKYRVITKGHNYLVY